MQRCFLKSKLHRMVVTQAELDYMGSITIDRDLMDITGLLEHEKVLVADIDTGNRFETYVLEGERGSGIICINGAAARLARKGDMVIIAAYVMMSEEEAKKFSPKNILVDSNNRIVNQTVK